MPDAATIGSIVLPIVLALFAVPAIVLTIMLVLRVRPRWRSRSEAGHAEAHGTDPRRAQADIPTEPIARP